MHGDGPAQNRVTPRGDIVAVAGRGAWMGNRGRLHEGAGTRTVVRHHHSRAWLICALSFKDYRAHQWHPHHYTPLFFLDEAVALAAGHRPCAECRRADFNRFREAWAGATGASPPSATTVDAQLHAERLVLRTRTHAVHAETWRALPIGAFVLVDDAPALVLDDEVRPWLPGNSYGDAVRRPRKGPATVLTPRSTVAALRAGYVPQLGVAR